MVYYAHDRLCPRSTMPTAYSKVPRYGLRLPSRQSAGPDQGCRSFQRRADILLNPDHLKLLSDGRQNVGPHFGDDGVEPFGAAAGHPSTDHHAVGIKHIDGVADPPPKMLRRLVDHPLGQHVASPGGLKHLFGPLKLNLLAPSDAPGFEVLFPRPLGDPGDGRPRSHRLEAAPFPARAKRAVGLDHHVPDLTCEV